ncbi:hypothetical protein [Bifidobacterium sp.]|uniref:hypothetical protein n=1 Tax=Bifidobacterium sp. TaxID=41200 RepID=UPI0025C4667F|nr:hypothetical protein [Bifidobacterium sp.]
MSLVTNLIPNPLLTFPNSAISLYETTVRHIEPDCLLITPNGCAVNPHAKIRLCEPVSGDFHLNFWIFQVPEDSQWYENGIAYLSNALDNSGVLLPHNNTGGNTLLGFDFHMDNMQYLQLKCPLNHPLRFSAINLMTQADWKEYKRLVPRTYALYGDLMPLQN